MECAGKRLGTRCTGPPTRRCARCEAVAYCSVSHQVQLPTSMATSCFSCNAEPICLEIGFGLSLNKAIGLVLIGLEMVYVIVGRKKVLISNVSDNGFMRVSVLVHISSYC